jgi:exonuclease VII large subunit
MENKVIDLSILSAGRDFSRRADFKNKEAILKGVVSDYPSVTLTFPRQSMAQLVSEKGKITLYMKKGKYYFSSEELKKDGFAIITEESIRSLVEWIL